MKDPRNEEPKLKAQESQTASSNNHSRSIKASEKNNKEKKKKFLREKREKRKKSESTLAIGVSMTNPILLKSIKGKRSVKLSSTIVARKATLPGNIPNLKKTQKTSIDLDNLHIGDSV